MMARVKRGVVAKAKHKKILDQAKRSGKPASTFVPFASAFLDGFCQDKKSYIQAQYLAMRRQFEKGAASSINDATFNEEVLNEFEKLWVTSASRLLIVPGKEALAAINRHLQGLYGVNITPTSIADAMKIEEVPAEMITLIKALGSFASTPLVEVT